MGEVVINNDKMDYILFKSENQNNYLYSYYNNSILYCDPILNKLLELDKQGINIKEWLYKIGKKHYYPDLGTISKTEINYYYGKYLFLKENNHFREASISEKLNVELNEAEIDFKLANVDHIVFEVTEDCNLQCEYCGYGDFYENFDERKRCSISDENILGFLEFQTNIWKSNKNLSLNNIITISFYGGEPLIESKLIQKVINKTKQIEKETKIRFQYRMTTNGLLIEKNIKLLLENSFKLSISIDGNKSNNAYRVFRNGAESFDTLLKNIKFLIDNYPDFYKDNVSFISVLHDRNSYESIIEFSKKVLLKKPSIIELNSNGLKESMKDLFLTKYRNLFTSFKDAKKNNCVDEDLTLANPELFQMYVFLMYHTNYIFDTYHELLNYYPTQKRYPTGTCIPFARKVFITSSGKVLPCERIGQLDALGIIENGQVFINSAAISEKMNTYFKSIKRLCNICYRHNSCDKCLYFIEEKADKAECSDFTDYEDAIRFFGLQMSIVENNHIMYSNIISKSKVI